MRAAILAAPNGFRIDKVSIPEPGPGAVRIRMHGCGVCGSNLAPFEGRPWFNYPFPPGQPGHEGWGEVDQVGPDVNGLKVGDRVAVLSYNAFADYDVAPQEAVAPLPPLLGDKPFPGEALGCAMNAFDRCQIRPGQTVAIIGIGFMGAILTQLAAQAGARVIAISRRPHPLEVAKQFGASEIIVMDDHYRIIDQVRKLTDGKGCDVVIEAVGLQWPLDLAAELTRERGRLVIAGYHQDGPRQVNMQLWNWRGLDVINAHERDPMVYYAGMRKAIDAVASGKLDPSLLYTHQFDLSDIGSAFLMMKDRPANFLKALVAL
ncbi:MAG: MDR/zinc-dependent alcohol dehydrogenase-like family protein [Verrucomicrobiales bacterium]